MERRIVSKPGENYFRIESNLLQNQDRVGEFRQLDERFTSALSRARAGETEELGEILSNLIPLLKKIARVYGAKDFHDVDGIVQTSFLNFLSKLDDFEDRGYTAFKGYVVTSVKRLVIDAVRKESSENTKISEFVRLNQIIREDQTEQVFLKLEGLELEQEVEDGIGQIQNDNHRNALVMRYFDDLDYAEIALRNNTTEIAAKVHVHRAIVALRGIIKKAS